MIPIPATPMVVSTGGGGLVERKSIRATGMVVSDSMDGVVYQNYDQQDNGSLVADNVSMQESEPVTSSHKGGFRQSELELQFPSSKVKATDQDIEMQSTAAASDRIRTPAINPTPARPVEMDDYIDLPGSHNIIFLLYGLVILFGTGMLVMFIFSQMEVTNVGATTPVLCYIIIIPVVFLILNCSINITMRQLESKRGHS
eukprot:sb/3470684/